MEIKMNIEARRDTCHQVRKRKRKRCGLKHQLCVKSINDPYDRLRACTQISESASIIISEHGRPDEALCA